VVSCFQTEGGHSDRQSLEGSLDCRMENCGAVLCTTESKSLGIFTNSSTFPDSASDTRTNPSIRKSSPRTQKAKTYVNNPRYASPTQSSRNYSMFTDDPSGPGSETNPDSDLYSRKRIVIPNYARHLQTTKLSINN
jgi:hypothetical protein